MIRQLPQRWFISTGKTQRVAPSLDSGRGVINGYADNLLNLPLRLNTGGGNERTGDRVNGSNYYTIYINGNPAPDIIETDRIVFNSRVFDVKAVNDMDEAGVFMSVLCEEAFPSTFSLSFDFSTFAGGDMAGQHGWTIDAGGDPTLTIEGLGSGTGAGGFDLLEETCIYNFAGLDVNQPWSISGICQHRPISADLGGLIRFGIGNVAGTTIGCRLAFSAGDGVLNQVTSIRVDDATTNVTGGPFAFPVNTPIPVILTYNGVSLSLTVNGSSAGTISAAHVAGVNTSLFIKAQSNSVLESFGLNSISARQP